MITDTLNMFVFLAAELTVLFLLISYIVGALQEYIPPDFCWMRSVEMFGSVQPINANASIKVRCNAFNL